MGDEVCLAERRKKQKWSSDPRGNSWSKDKDKFGFRMLEKMGWSDGTGLGAEQDGNRSHVKINFKNNTLGLGTTTQHADDWIEHQSDFDGLLASLQQHQATSEPNSAAPSGRSSPSAGLQAKAQKSRARINYSKFLRGKDISGYSNTDMSCILGQRAACTQASTTKVDDSATSRTRHRSSDSSSSSDGSGSDSDSSDSESSEQRKQNGTSHDPNGIHTTTSGQSVQDYFAVKMAKLQQSRTLSKGSSSFITATMGLSANASSSSSSSPASSQDNSAASRSDTVATSAPVTVARKRKHKRAEDAAKCSDSDGAKKSASPSDNEDDDTRAPKKKKKKSLKSKKKRKEAAAIAESEDEAEEVEPPPKIAEKKSKKSKRAVAVKDQVSDDDEEEEQVHDPPKKKKSKKSKKSKK